MNIPFRDWHLTVAKFNIAINALTGLKLCSYCIPLQKDVLPIKADIRYGVNTSIYKPLWQVFHVNLAK